MDRGSLTSAVVRGSVWMLALKMARRLSSAVGAVVLAHFLTPAHFGAVAVGLLSISFVQVLTEIGVRQNLVQERRHSKELIHCAWTLEVIRGLLLTGAVFFLAPVAAAFFNQPHTTSVIRGLSTVPLIRSLQNIKIIYFERELQFGRLFLYELSSAVAGLLIAVVAAIVLRNEWALVLGQIGTAVILVVFSYLWFPEFPRLEFDPGSLRQLYSFGKWVLLATVVSYFSLQGDKFFVGRWFDAHTLGMYTMAAMVVDMTTNELGKSIAHVLFPAYARIKVDRTVLSRAFLKSYQAVLCVLLPACIGLYLVADDLVPLVFGGKWLGLSAMIQLLTLAAAVRSLFVAASGLVLALNRPQDNFMAEAVRAVALLVLLLFVPAAFGLKGIPLALLGSNVIALLVYRHLWSRLLQVTTADFARIYLVVGILLVCLVVPVIAIRAALDPGAVRLTASVLTGAGVFCLGALLMDRYFGISLVH